MNVDTHEISDEQLATRAQDGDAEAFGALVDRYEQKLLRYGTKFLARSEDIEDIVQDVFLSAYRSIQGFDVSLRFSPWIYRIAHNAFVNALRKREREPIFLDFDTLLSHETHDDSHVSEQERREVREMLDRGLTRLPPKYREVLVLHYFEDMAYKDIADVLHVPLGTVSVRIRRAKEMLKQQLQNNI